MVDVTKKADLGLIDAGGWQPLKNFRGAKVLITSFETAAVRRLRDELHDQIFGERVSDVEDQGVLNYITARLLVDACVRNWENFDDGSSPMPFSREKLRSLVFKPGEVIGEGFRSPDGYIYDPAAKYLYDDLVECAFAQEKAARDQALKEKKPPNNGSTISAENPGGPSESKKLTAPTQTNTEKPAG
ncbi:MAG: hypothetical protein AAGB02_03155 [Pseudomonadota bacterium]